MIKIMRILRCRSGLGGIEIAHALRQRWPQKKINIITNNKNLDLTVKESLKRNDIEIGGEIARYGIMCTGSVGHDWISSSNLPCHPKTNRIYTNTRLQVLGLSDIFACGDCAVIREKNNPANGVFAVKAAHVLEFNLSRIDKQNYKSWVPQKSSLQLVGSFKYKFVGPIGMRFCGPNKPCGFLRNLLTFSS